MYLKCLAAKRIYRFISSFPFIVNWSVFDTCTNFKSLRHILKFYHQTELLSKILYKVKNFIISKTNCRITVIDINKCFKQLYFYSTMVQLEWSNNYGFAILFNWFLYTIYLQYIFSWNQSKRNEKKNAHDILFCYCIRIFIMLYVFN